MKSLILLFLFGAVGISACPFYPCGGTANLFGGYLNFSSIYYPYPYPSGVDCLWRVYAVSAPALHLYCNYFDTTYSAGCNVDSFDFSPSGDCFMSDAVSYCGYGTLHVTTSGKYLAVRFRPRYTGTGYHTGFFCYIYPAVQTTTSLPTTPPPPPPTTTTTATLPPTTTTTTLPPSTTTTTLPPTTTTTTLPPSTTTATLPPTTTSATVPPTSPSTTTITITTTDTTSPTSQSSGSCSCGIKGGSRIVGGTETSVHEYPWQVGIKMKDTSQNEHIFCGGTLISDQWVLSAAHCFESVTKNQISVVLGEHDQTVSSETTSTQTMNVANIFRRSDYDPNTVDNDIALLELESPVTLNEAIDLVCLPYPFQNSDFQGEVGTAVGWGTLQSQGVVSDVLMEVNLPYLTTDECKNYSIVSNWITDNMFCTYSVGKDACQGDSGGPLLFEQNGIYYQTGIVSFGFGCGDIDSPGVYTKLTNYLSWIEATTGETFCKP